MTKETEATRRVDGIQLRLGDCNDILVQYVSEFFRAVITDPPYG